MCGTRLAVLIKWSASRKDKASKSGCGLAQPEVGNTELPATNRLSDAVHATSWSRPPQNGGRSSCVWCPCGDNPPMGCRLIKLSCSQGKSGCESHGAGSTCPRRLFAHLSIELGDQDADRMFIDLAQSPVERDPAAYPADRDRSQAQSGCGDSAPALHVPTDTSPFWFDRSCNHGRKGSLARSCNLSNMRSARPARPFAGLARRRRLFLDRLVETGSDVLTCHRCVRAYSRREGAVQNMLLSLQAGSSGRRAGCVS